MPWPQTFDHIDDYSRFLADTYERATVDMLAIIRKRLETGADAPDWALRKLAEYRATLTELRRKVPDMSKEVTTLVDKAYRAGAKEAADELAIAELPGASPLARGSAVKALALEASTAVKSTRLRVLREVADTYRSVIADVVAQHLTGGDTIRQAVQSGLRSLANNGITGFVDGKGNRWSLPSYVEMAVRTTSANAAREGHLNKLESVGADLVRVSAHGDACPMCGPLEGRILSISGKDKRYMSLAQAIAAGLYHPNCRHRVGIYLPGVSTERDTAGIPYDPKAYRATQTQRKNERMIRQWKRREAVAITDQEKALTKAKVKQWQAAQREHVTETNKWYKAKNGPNTQLLRRRYEREKLDTLGLGG